MGFGGILSATRRRLARGLVALFALSVLLMTVPAAAATEGAGVSDRNKDDPAVSRPRPEAPPEDPWSDIQALEAYAREHLADTFGGLYVEDGGSSQVMTVVVNVTRPPTAEQERAMRNLVKNRSLRIRQVQYSLTQLEQAQKRITEAMADLGRQGVDIAWVGADVMANRVSVGVTGSPAEAERILGQRVPREMLQVVQGEHMVPLVQADGGEPTSTEAEDAVITDEATTQMGAPQAADDAEGRSEGATPKLGVWQRLWAQLVAWWKALFG